MSFLTSQGQFVHHKKNYVKSRPFQEMDNPETSAISTRSNTPETASRETNSWESGSDKEWFVENNHYSKPHVEEQGGDYYDLQDPSTFEIE
jgi:hypothetical protein